MRIKLPWSRNWCGRKSARPVVFTFCVTVRKKAGKSLKASWTVCRAGGMRDARSPGHCCSICSWVPGSTLLFKAWARKLHKSWVFRAEGHSMENEEEWQKFSPKACQGRTSLVYITCARMTQCSCCTFWSRTVNCFAFTLLQAGINSLTQHYYPWREIS